MATRKETWKDVKAALARKNKAELLKLIADLYSLSADNKSFVHSRYAIGKDTLEPYRAIISESLYPDVRKDGAIESIGGEKSDIGLLQGHQK